MKKSGSNFLKRAVASLMVLTMAASLAACGSSSDSTSTTASTTAEAIEVEVTESETSSPEGTLLQTNGKPLKDYVCLAYPMATSVTPWGTDNKTPGAYEVYETLFICNDDDVTSPIPLLADCTRGEFGGYDHEDGSGVYTIYIWDYIYDHNGNHITADDVAFSYNHQWTNEVTSGWGDLVSIEALDDTTIQFTFNEEITSITGMEDVFCKCAIVSEETYNNSPSNLLSEMIGTGPYKMVQYTPANSVTIERNDNYWQTNDEYRIARQATNVQTVDYKFYGETSTKLMSMQTGEVDIADDITTLDAEDFAEGGPYSDRFNVYAYPAALIYNLWFNCDEASICGDVNMRKAICYAIDLDGIVALMGGTDASAYTYASAAARDFIPAWTEMENYNSFRGSDEERSALVQEYLDAAGYDGSKLILMYQSDQSAFATIIISMLANYGINVEGFSTDYSGSVSLRGDPTGWDMEFNRWGDTYAPIGWQHIFDWANTAEEDHTPTYIYNQEWQDLLKECYSIKGHTEENMTRWLEILYDNAYAINTYEGIKNIIYPSDMEYLYVYQTSNVIPGACEYDTQ